MAYKSQDKGKMCCDMDRDCKKLCVSPFYNEINHDKSLAMFSAPKCSRLPRNKISGNSHTTLQDDYDPCKLNSRQERYHNV